MSKSGLTDALLWGARPEWPAVSSLPNPGGLVATPDHVFVRRVHNDGVLRMPDGRRLEYWGFEDERGRISFPSPTIRVRQGNVTQVTLDARMSEHTIHFHGIEPEPYNDGVGHTSFDVEGSYVYQWRASQAGTYWYHCHVNTVLHVQMGMMGMLIVDPPEGPGVAYEGGPRYQLERIWAGCALDASWRGKNHNAGQDGADEGFNDINPDYFALTGIPRQAAPIIDPTVGVQAGVGDTILIRCFNGSYLPQEFSWGGLEGEIIASDGRPLPGGRSIRTKRLRTSPGERYDVLLRPSSPGRYVGSVDFFHWTTNSRVGTVEALIEVASGPTPEPTEEEPPRPGTASPVEPHPADAGGTAPAPTHETHHPATPGPGSAPAAPRQAAPTKSLPSPTRGKRRPKPKHRAKVKPKARPKPKPKARPKATPKRSRRRSSRA